MAYHFGRDMELTQSLAERYGFTDNPDDTKTLSISKAASLSSFVPKRQAAIEEP